MGTSVGDSESEAESLGEPVRENEDNPPREDEANDNNSSEDEEERVYNYGEECEDEQEGSSSSDDRSEGEDDFMKDRQTNEDFSAYRERIFDFTPQGYKQKKSLVEEINNEDAPGTSGVTEVSPSYNHETKKQANRSENAFNFQILVDHMSQAEGIESAAKETKDKPDEDTKTTKNDSQETKNNQHSDSSTDEEDTERETKHMKAQREKLVNQATERVRRLDMTSLTFEEYMTTFDKPPVKEDNADRNSEADRKEVSEDSCNMTKNIAPGNVTNENNEGTSSDSTLTDSKTLKDIMEENNVIHGGSDSDDSDSSENEEQNEPAVSEKGDGPPPCRLRKPEDIKAAIKSVLTSNTKQMKYEESVMGKYSIESNETTTKYEETYEDTFEFVEINNTETKDVSENISEISDSKYSNTDEIKEEETIMKIHNEELVMAKKNNSDSEESYSSDGEEQPYYRKLDKLESTKLQQIEENTEEVSAVKSKKEIKDELTGDHQEENSSEEDASYKEILKWDLKVSDANVQILLPIKRKGSEEDFKDELCDLLARTKREEKPEFEITPPKDIAEENDTILYARNTKESICVRRYKSIYTETGKKGEVKPPLVHKVLKLSQNYPIFQKNQTEVVKNEVEEEASTTENSLIVCNKISEVRDQMAQFTKNLEEFNERSRLAREEVIKDYNSAVEKELKIVDKLMAMKKNMFDKKYTKPTWEAMRTRKVEHMDKNVMRKHFEDMDMILEEDSDSEEEEQELKAAMERINKKHFRDMGLDPMQSRTDADEEEIVLSKVPTDGNYDDYEEEKKDESKEMSGEGIVLIDSESYEEYLTTNEEDEEYEDANKYDNNSDTYEEDKIDNVKERNNESCEEYYTTNEEDSDEDYDNGKPDATVEEPVNYQQFINKLRKQAEDESNKEEEREDENYKEAVASQYNEKETDEKATIGKDLRKYEVDPVIKRNISCSLEMQLAKKTDEDV